MSAPRPKPGDPLRIPAETFNALVDLLHERGPVNTGTYATRAQHILIKNESAVECPRFGALSVGQPMILPGENLAGFASTIAFRAAAPQNAANLDRFAVAQEPIPAGGIGRAIIAGLTIAKVNVAHASLNAARPVIGQVGPLETAAIGTTILWREGGTGEQYAIIDLSHRQQLIRFELATALTPGGVASAKIRDAGVTLDISITVTDALGIFYGSASTPGIAIYMPDAARYEILQLRCG